MKNKARALLRWMAALLLLCATGRAYADARADLASPSQEVRDAAAKIVRKNYQPVPRKKWDAMMVAVKEGDSPSRVKEVLAPYGVDPGPPLNGNSESMGAVCRVDDDWFLECLYTPLGGVVYPPVGMKFSHYLLMRHVREIGVEPPANFTGLWTCYYANGQRFCASHYKDGKLLGVNSYFYDDGSLAEVQRYNTPGHYDEEVDYFRTGEVRSRGIWSPVAQMRKWTYYKKNGAVESVEEYAETAHRYDTEVGR